MGIDNHGLRRPGDRSCSSKVQRIRNSVLAPRCATARVVLLLDRGLSLELRPGHRAASASRRGVIRIRIRVRVRVRRRRPGLALSLFQTLRHLPTFPVLALAAALSRRFRSWLVPLLRRATLLLLGLALTLDDARKVVRDPKVERRRLELDLAAHDLRPLVPRGVDPPHQIQMVHAFERSKVRAL